MSTGTEVAREATRRDDLRRRLRGTSGRGRKLRGLLVLLRPYRMRVILMFVALVAGTAASLAPAPLAKTAIDSGILKGDTKTLDLVVLAFIVSALVVWGASYAQTYLVGWVGQRSLADLRIQILRHLQEMPVGFYERRPAGVLISRMTNDVEALDSLVTDTVVTLFSASLTLIGSVAILLFLDVQLALITFLIFPVMAVGSLAFRVASADAYRRTRETVAQITAYLQESLSGIRVVQGLRPGAAPPRRVPPPQRDQPRCEPRDGQPQRRVLPARRVRLGDRDRRDPDHRRAPGDQRRTSRSACSSASSPRSTASSTRSASSRRSTRPTSRAWRRWTRSSSCSTSSPS